MSDVQSWSLRFQALRCSLDPARSKSNRSAFSKWYCMKPKFTFQIIGRRSSGPRDDQ